jgi:hypothetical protein
MSSKVKYNALLDLKKATIANYNAASTQKPPQSFGLVIKSNKLAHIQQSQIKPLQSFFLVFYQ